MLGLILRYEAVKYTQVDAHVQRADAGKYIVYAYNLKKYGVYSSYHPAKVEGHPERVKPDAQVTPGYPLFIRLFFNDSGLHINYLLLSQAILSTLTIILAYLLFVSLGRGWALLVALLCACSPHLVSLSTYMLTETLFCFLLMVFLVLASRFTQARWWLFGIAGIVLALSTLTRPWTQAFVIVLVIFLPLALSRQKFMKPIVLLLGFVIVISPWLVRNYLAIGNMTDPTLSFVSIHHGMYPDMMYNFQPESRGFAYQFDPWPENSQISAQDLFDELSSRAAENPWVYLKWYLWGKMITVFSWDIIAGMGDIFIYPVIQTPYTNDKLFKITYNFVWVVHPILVLLGLIGAILAWLPSAKKHLPLAFLFLFRLLSLLVFYFLLLHIIGAPYPRYSIPMRPVTYGMAIAVLAWLTNYLKYVSSHRSDSRL